jgi:NAD+ diphosphatase
VLRRTAFEGFPLDRASHRRREADTLLNEPRAELIVLRAGQPLLEVPARDLHRPLRLAASSRAAVLGADAPTVFLGMEDTTPVFAADAGRQDPTAPGGKLEGLATFMELRQAAGAGMDPGELALLGMARALFDWHARHRFCAACGTPTAAVEGGWKRACGGCGAEHFPRVDPVVIMLPTRRDSCLVGRQKRFPPGMHSALAGFVEPGESIVEACIREIAEEVGLIARGARIVATQPWPFPSQLMVGLIAEVEDGPVTLDTEEIEAAVWLRRQEVEAALQGPIRHPVAGRLWLPPAVAVAHTLMQAWIEAGPT